LSKDCYNEKKVLNSHRKNYLSPQITEHKETMIYGVGVPGPDLKDRN